MEHSMNNGAANNNSNNEGGRIIMTNGTIKTMEVFAGTVKCIVETVYGDGYTISIQPMTKNNGTRLTGLTISKKGVNIAPNIYLESLFERYQDGMTMEAVCREVMDIYEQYKETQDFDSRKITEFHQVRDRICFRLVNTEKNKELLADIPYIPYLDLAIVFYVLVSKDAGGTSTVLIRNSFIDSWGTDTQTLYSIAIENTQRIFRGSVQSMGNVMAEIMEVMLDAEDSKEFYDMAVDTEDRFPMYVATNYEKLNGASVLLYPNLLRDFAEQIRSDFYILPSSIHEVIFVPESAGMDIEYMKTMVQEINVTQVADEEILSDNVYFYNRACDRVEMM